MKIGILTIWHSNDNYGQILQCYALQKYLRNCGHDAFLIKAVNDTEIQPSKKKRIIGIIRKMFTYRYWSLLVFRYKLRKFNKQYGYIDRRFEKFRNKYIHSTDAIYDINKLNNIPEQCDAYITGSDQVWGSVSKVFFLTFIKTKPKYSYAASFGSNPFTPTGCKMMKKYLSTFKEVTVREEKGVQKCKELGIEAKRIIDPTGLLTKDDYLTIAEKPHDNDYILIYLLGNYTNINIHTIYNYAQKKNYKVKYIASQARNDKYEKIFPSPTEWLGLIANAKFVLTNSYHCCMFSIYFQKKFIAYELIDIFKNMNDRLDTLFEQYNIPRIKDIKEIENCQFDYDKINLLINKDRDKAQQILNSWFSL